MNSHTPIVWPEVGAVWAYALKSGQYAEGVNSSPFDFGISALIAVIDDVKASVKLRRQAVELLTMMIRLEHEALHGLYGNEAAQVHTLPGGRA